MIVRHIPSSREDTLKFVKEFSWAQKSPSLLAIVETEDSTQVSGVYYFNDHQWHLLKKQKAEYAKPSVSADGRQVAFIANHDTTKAQVPPWQLYYHDFRSDSALSIAKMDSGKLSLISHHADLRWSDWQ